LRVPGSLEKKKTKKNPDVPLGDRPGFFVRFRLRRCFQRPAGCACGQLRMVSFRMLVAIPASFSIGFRAVRFDRSFSA
jgi:hypothetical protein